MIGLKRQKWAEAGLIHYPHRVDTSWQATKSNKIREADPSDRPQKMSNICLELKLLHYVKTMARSVSWPVNVHSVSRSNIETAGPCGRPKIFFCHCPVFAVDVADDDESPASTVDFTGDDKLGVRVYIS